VTVWEAKGVNLPRLVYFALETFNNDLQPLSHLPIQVGTDPPLWRIGSFLKALRQNVGLKSIHTPARKKEAEVKQSHPHPAGFVELTSGAVPLTWFCHAGVEHSDVVLIHLFGESRQRSG